MDKLCRFKAFFLSICTFNFQLLRRAALATLPPASAAPPTNNNGGNLEAMAEHVHRPPPAAPVADQFNLKWAMIMLFLLAIYS